MLEILINLIKGLLFYVFVWILYCDSRSDDISLLLKQRGVALFGPA